MKNMAKRITALVMTFLLAFPTGIGLSEEQAMSFFNAADPSFDEGSDVDAVSAADTESDDSEDEVFSDAVDPEVGEADDAELGGDDEHAPDDVGVVTTYWFLVNDALYNEQIVGDGEAIQRPDDPDAPEGMVFSGWFLEDGTQLFAEGEEISHADEEHPFVNVLARFEDAVEPVPDMPGDGETVPGSEEAVPGATPVHADATGETTPNTTEDDVENAAESTTTPDAKGEECGEDAGDATSDGDESSTLDEDETPATEKENAEDGVETAPEKDETDVTDEDQDVDSDKAEADEAPDGEQSESEETSDQAQDVESDAAEILPVCVTFSIEPEDAVVTVFAVQNNDEYAGKGEAEEGTEQSETVAVEAEEDGTYLLLPGGYTYSVTAEGYKPLESVAFTVADEPLIITVEMEVKEAEEAHPVSVVFNATPETAVVTVYDAAAEGEPEAIAAQEDGSFLLVPGEYTYTAAAEGYISVEAVPFTVTDEPLEIAFEMEAEAVEEPKEPASFDQSCTIGTVTITVRAEAGAFPAGAELEVSLVNLQARREADEAIDEIRDEGQNVAASYTYDIKVMLNGQEIQPAEGYHVEVSFAMARAADENLEANVYHMTEDGGELTAEKLDTDVDEIAETVTATTDGFSLYTVEFTYDNLEYVMQGDTSVPLTEILAELGLTGAAEAVSVSNDSLFDATFENGEWIVTAKQPFTTTEWMKVVIGGITYEIVVTDDQVVTQNSTYWTANMSAVGSVTVNNRVYVVDNGDITLTLTEGSMLYVLKGIYVPEGSTLTIKGTGTLYAGISASRQPTCEKYCAGIGGGYFSNGSEVKLKNLTGKTGGTIIIEGGNITAVGGDIAAGIGGSGDGGNGGNITITGSGTVVKATAGDSSVISGVQFPGGAGIGGGSYGDGVSITIKDGADVTATGKAGGAGIGGGTGSFDIASSIREGGSGGTIEIKGGAKVVAIGESGGAGIGGGNFGPGGSITISDSATNVSAEGGAAAAGIGSGNSRGFDDHDELIVPPGVNGGNINISGGTVQAQGGERGAGIGGGRMALASAANGAISISGGTITATGGEMGAGIGNGDEASGNGTIHISGGTVRATGGILAAGIGGSRCQTSGQNYCVIVISDGANITSAQGGAGAVGGAGGAGIGGGFNSHGGSITINGGTVKAKGGERATYGDDDDSVEVFGGAGIGGGMGGAGSGSGHKIAISGGTIEAYGDETAAGIGGGINGLAGTVEISGGINIKAFGGARGGAGIGTGSTCSSSSSDCNSISITGGKIVEVHGGTGAAGIGSGENSPCGQIEISDCTIEKVYGGDGHTYRSDMMYGGAGIGGGYGSIGGTIIISSGTFGQILGGVGAAGIGGGFACEGGSTTIKAGKFTLIKGGTGTLIDGTDIGGAGIGGGHFGHGGTIKIENGEFGQILGGANAAGIGGGNQNDGGNITLSGGTFTKIQGGTGTLSGNTGTGGAGIGGGYNSAGGTIIISSGTFGQILGGAGAAGIGGGHFGPGGNITLSGGTFTNIQGGEISRTQDGVTSKYGAAGIGGGYNSAGGTIKIEDGEFGEILGARASAGIGGGSYNNCGNITISGGTFTSIQGGELAAGIGNGVNSQGGTIIIQGGTITQTTGGTGGAGIGGSYRGSVATITIKAGTITAQGGEGGAGIGGGNGVEDRDKNVVYGGGGGTITIEGGTIVAIGGSKGAGIGGGVFGGSGTLEIKGGDSIKATGGDLAAGIGSGIFATLSTSDKITISGGVGIEAQGGFGAAGIGGGAGVGGDYGGAGGTITIKGGTIAKAKGGGEGTYITSSSSGDGGTNTEIYFSGGAGIGGGCRGKSGTITIQGGTITQAAGGKGGAGIGGGYRGDVVTITLSGGKVTQATGGFGAAGIGAGDNASGGSIIIKENAELGTITGGTAAAGIGGGNAVFVTENDKLGFYTDVTGGTIEISGGTIANAKGGGYGTLEGHDITGGAGIGGGCFSSPDSVVISGGNIKAAGSDGGAGIGGGYKADGGSITISGGVVNAEGAPFYDGASGIGSGFDAVNATITLKWTDASKESIAITATSYGGIVETQSRFYYVDGSSMTPVEVAKPVSAQVLTAVESKTLRACPGYLVNIATGIQFGSVTASPIVQKKDQSVTLTVTPETDYDVSTLTVKGKTSGNTITPTKVSGTDNQYTFKMPGEDVTVSATFYLAYHAVNIPTFQHGSVTASPTRQKKDQSVVLTVTPETDYDLATLTVKGKTSGNTITPTKVSGTDNKYTFTMPDEEVDVSATFFYPWHAIDIPTFQHGSVSANPTRQKKDLSVTLTVTPETDYTLVNLTVKGKTSGDTITPTKVSGTDNKYTFTMPDEEVDVSATFFYPWHAIDIPTFQHGSVSANPTRQKKDLSVTLTVTPEDNYALKEITVTCGGQTIAPDQSTEDENVWTFTMPDDDVDVSATFYNTTMYAINIDSEIVNGTVVADVNTQHETGPVTLTVTPDDGCIFRTLTVTWEGGEITPVQSTTNEKEWTFEMPEGAVAVSATFYKLLTGKVYYFDPTAAEGAQVKVRNNGEYAEYLGQTVLDGGWYVVAGDWTVEDRIVVNGDARIILCDGAKLTAKQGIGAAKDKDLTFYAGAAGSENIRFTGALELGMCKTKSPTANSIVDSYTALSTAGTLGKLAIYGGVIEADAEKTGLPSASGNYPAIYTQGNVEILGANTRVTLKGYCYDIICGLKLTVTDSTVTATSSGSLVPNTAISMGSGATFKNAQITAEGTGNGIAGYGIIAIDGGTVTANGTDGNGRGIKAIDNAVQIDGGNVTVSGGAYGIEAYSTTKISGGKVSANGKVGIGNDDGSTTITLTWNPTASGGAPELPEVTASSYNGTVVLEKFFRNKTTGEIYDATTSANAAALAKVTLVPNEAEYRVDVSQTNGAVVSDTARAKAGSTVTLTVYPHYALSSLTVRQENASEDLHIDGVDDTHYTFTMPESAVYVAATWTLKPVGYFDPTAIVGDQEKQQDTYTPLINQTTLNQEWYVVAGDVFIENRMTVRGKVNLILCDNSKLTAKQGITVTKKGGNSLKIWAQSDGEDMGELYAGTTDGTDNYCYEYSAGIGGVYIYYDHDLSSGGEITVNGGKIVAKGSGNPKDINYMNGAAIGGSGYFGHGGTMVFNGGTVTAVGLSSGAGIGGGQRGSSGSITITGGRITATSAGGAGIGSGEAGNADTIIITGGTVVAEGKKGAGIGGGMKSTRYNTGGNFTSIQISGGNVTATSEEGSGIGGGWAMRYTDVPDFVPTGTITLDWSEATKDSMSVTAKRSDWRGKGYSGTVKLVKPFKYGSTLLRPTGDDDALDADTLNAIIGKTLTPAVFYDIDISLNIANGKVSTDPADSAFAGATVTLTLEPDQGYAIKSVSVTDAENAPVSVSEDYTFTMPSGNVTISAVFKRPISPQVSISDWMYGETPSEPSIVDGGNPGGGGVTYVYYRNSYLRDKTSVKYDGATEEGGRPVYANNYWVVATVAETDDCLSGTSAAKKFTIQRNSGAVVINSSTNSWTYDGTTHKDETYTVTYGKTNITADETGRIFTLPTGDKVTIVPSAGGVKDYKASYANNNSYAYSFLHADGYTASNCYASVTKSVGTLSIDKRNVTLNSETASKTYDSTPLTKPTVTGWQQNDTDGTGFVKDEVSDVKATGSVTDVAEGDVTNAITYKEGTGFKADNYNITKNEGTLSIDPKAVTITAKGAKKTYDGTALFEAGFTASDLEPDDTHVFTVAMTNASTIKNVGTQPNVIATVDGTEVTTGTETPIGNYLVTTVDGKLSINPKALTITAESKSKVEGENDPALTYSVTGLLKGEQLSGSLTRESGELLGTYRITQGTLKASENYKVTFNGATLTINAKPELTFKGDISEVATTKPVGNTILAYAWSKVEGAEGYDLFFKVCDGKGGYGVIQSITDPDVLSFDVPGLKKGAAYKSYVRAWRIENGVKTYIGEPTPYIHAIAGGYNKAKKICNAKAVIVKKPSVTLKVRRKSRIKARVVGVKKGYKVLKHVARLRYYSSDKNVAKVNKKGRITAVAPGTCTIYVMANNGVYTTVTVTVTN